MGVLIFFTRLCAMGNLLKLRNISQSLVGLFSAITNVSIDFFDAIYFFVPFFMRKIAMGSFMLVNLS